ncbi:MAG: hypothetical protein A2499_11990 [Stygiobacter sp. RIFOXYC12_FULL_38_8]|nr:MAG: hypothetical protein A2X62_07850 [Stygiobacter sp. GWC2_38_9]OGU77242.1 MAG: hypothetical protein A2279_03900 [Stygiobacter sp. RIFOXYA12_FULL_38_9]OGV05786.1 MAG: hypothetical protein A2299_10135 [Stygiobacter sp. RIFOXYB2_FULL_37_11]OGV12994.1 MAG: hypothetical protein A2440_17060 [Stygiobacter sp. RIFOXYC2_FULL_38_25]OGV14848.1 MAG: hypothetical protein A2237_01895 [Stygiobacter sp. RIFOXYA2_FULL_38_8]OGV23708.1 MAG: hypothetical protein A2499_11990 [Stygiobacter sp. RIFOXYC12_FULL_
MRTKLFLIVFFAIAFGATLRAQSDYEKTQNFKARYQQLETAIKNATSLDECNTISENIAMLKSEFLADKGLLDNSLYPENFESSFSKIERAVEIRKGDFTQITELTTEVGTLKDKISTISQENQGLIAQIRTLQIRSAKDAQTIASLQKLVAQLKANIQQRDELVRGIVDSLLAQFVQLPGGLNEAEKQNIYTKVDAGNLFYNIERTIADNVQFMKVTQMTPADLGEMKKQYKDFNKVWRQIGPKLAEVYLNRKDKTAQIANIDAMFADWNIRVNDEMWGQVNKLFREKKIAMLQFKSGEQFVNSVESFVGDEIKNLGVKSGGESENIYNAFTDSVYFRVVEPVWIPILIENNMMTDANKDSIDSHIAKWKEKVAPGSSLNWVYIGGGAVIVFLVIAFFMKGRKKHVVRYDEKKEDAL